MKGLYSDEISAKNENTKIITWATEHIYILDEYQCFATVIHQIKTKEIF